MSNNKNKQMEKNSNPEIQEDIKKLVLARIMAASDDLRVAIGSTEYTKTEMIENVKAENEVGKEIMDIQMEYLRDMASGVIYQSSQ